MVKGSTQESVFVQLQGKVFGPYKVKELAQLRGYTPQSLISFVGSEKWAPAYRVLNINPDQPPLALITVSPDFQFDFPGQKTAATFYWKAPKTPPSWVDRWFRRLAFANALLLVAGIGAWS